LVVRRLAYGEQTFTLSGQNHPTLWSRSVGQDAEADRSHLIDDFQAYFGADLEEAQSGATSKLDAGDLLDLADLVDESLNADRSVILKSGRLREDSRSEGRQAGRRHRGRVDRHAIGGGRCAAGGRWTGGRKRAGTRRGWRYNEGALPARGGGKPRRRGTAACSP
jgi:hypothetical protein